MHFSQQSQYAVGDVLLSLETERDTHACAHVKAVSLIHDVYDIHIDKYASIYLSSRLISVCDLIVVSYGINWLLPHCNFTSKNSYSHDSPHAVRYFKLLKEAMNVRNKGNERVCTTLFHIAPKTETRTKTLLLRPKSNFLMYT